jgi:membrane protease YdiL (CAAX protease family)
MEKDLYIKNKETLITIFFILSSLFLYVLFPAEELFQKGVIIIVFFVLLPILFIKFVLKRNNNFYGLEIGDWKKGVLWSAYAIFIMFIVLLFLIKYFNFFSYYTIPFSTIIDFNKFILYEFLIVLFFIAIYEFYFRGFIMFLLISRFKYWAIVIQFLIFSLLILSTRDVLVIYLFLPYLIFSPLAGIIAQKSRSIIYSALTQFLIIICLDVVFIKMVK